MFNHSTRRTWAVQWMLVNTIAFAASWSVFWFVRVNILRNVGHIVASGISGIAAGIAVWVLQWVVLGPRFPNAGWWSAGTGLGVTIAWVTFWCIKLALPVGTNAVIGGIAGVVAGASAGILQWLAFSRQDARTIGWVPISLVGWASGWAIGIGTELVGFHWLAVSVSTVLWATTISGSIQLVILRRIRDPRLWFGLWAWGNVLGGVASVIIWIVGAIISLILSYAPTMEGNFSLLFGQDVAAGLTAIGETLTRGTPGVALRGVLTALAATGGALAGAVTGFTQRVILRESDPLPGWWVPVTMVGWAVVWSVGYMQRNVWPGYAIRSTLPGVLAGLVIGLITRATLLKLVQEPAAAA